MRDEELRSFIESDFGVSPSSIAPNICIPEFPASACGVYKLMATHGLQLEGTGADQ